MSDKFISVDANSTQITDLLAQSPIYAKDVTVQAYQVNHDQLINGEYAKFGVLPDSQGGFVIYTYVMVNCPDGRIPTRESDSQPVRPGDWIVVNPARQPGDYPNCYAKTDSSFHERYEATNQAHIYRAKGLIRIAKNPTSANIQITAYWGDSQQGDAECYICAPVNRQDLDDLGINKRYLLSKNDFDTTYRPVTDVLGVDWHNKL